ncbi:unnamed protein product [Coregonus sp. 'balchen']|nr:unnamed protein product [Coregonus sp. 'balchen']
MLWPCVSITAGSMATNGEEASGGEDGSESEVAELRQKVESLQQELKTCKKELTKLQKQLTKSEKLQKSTEGYNEDLRKQVDKLSAEIHERKAKAKEKVRAEAETQTEEYTWSETDYYNYYYGGGYYHGDGVATDTQGIVIAEGQEATDASEMTPAESTTNTATDTITDTMADTATATVTEVSVEGGIAASQPEQEVDAGSIADMLRATAEQAMTQTGFVFDETTGMYYDHSTGFYYDSASQLYYDNNTGMYYYYDAESGKYQFHSRIEVPTVQPASETNQEKKSLDQKGRKWKKVPEKASRQNEKGLVKELELEEWMERRIPKRGVASRRQRGRSVTPDAPPQKKSSSKTRRAKSAERSLKRKKRKDWSRSDDASSSRRKKAKSDKRSSKKKAAASWRDGLRGHSEPEEGEITESEGEWKSTSSSSSPPPTKDSSESEMECQEVAEEVWPPCVRVTVVRSPVEKEMNHAIRISEMGVSKCYMLVDQGSQNGTVLNGNRILQPKAKCDPCPLTHGDEVKMGETVLSFHIHSGTDTCDGCEPGQVMAHLGKHQRNQPVQTGPAPTKEDKELLRQKELKQMKVKYGLKTVGSEGAFQRDDAPASVHVEISEVNKGRKMLEKMGWKKGEGLGKDGAGMKDPIQLKIRKSQSGLGAGVAVSVDEAGSLSRTKTQRNWEKARERFNDTCQPDTPTVKKEQGPVPKPWVKGEVTE